jgi:hypothetical protein
MSVSTRSPGRPRDVARRLVLGACVAVAALVCVPGVANASHSTCTFTPSSLLPRVDVFDGNGGRHLEIGRSGSSIAIADHGEPLKLCPGPTGNATVFNTDRIVVHGDGGQFSVQTLAPGKTPESDGNSELETIISSAAPTHLSVFGTVGPDTMRVADHGGIMLGSDLDVDIRDSSAERILVQGGFGNDYLSGRGGFPASIPGPSTVNVTMLGQDGDDIVIDGPLSGDQLQGNGGNDTLFSHDFRSFDVNFGMDGFDQVTMDPEDSAPSDNNERINVVGVGRLKLAPAAVTAHAGKPVRVKLAWKHPKA